MNSRLWNTGSYYGLIAKLLHWLSALLLIIMLGLGFYMTGFFGTRNRLWYTLHKQLGMCFLGISVLRLLNMLQGTMVRSKMRGQHNLLYVCLLLMPISGWVMSSASGYAPSLLGVQWFVVASDQPGLARFAWWAHYFLSIVVSVLIIWHIGQLLCDYLQGRNRIRRMWA